MTTKEQQDMELVETTVKLCVSTVASHYDTMTKEELIELLKTLPEKAEAILRTRMNN